MRIKLINDLTSENISPMPIFESDYDFYCEMPKLIFIFD